MTQSAIRATYVDFKNVKTRKVVQLVFEVPVEEAEAALKLLGIPDASKEQWVGIALLRQEKAAPKEKTEGERAVQRAAILCTEPQFWSWLQYERQLPSPIENESECAALVRQALGCKSRSEIATSTRVAIAWQAMEGRYRDYQRYGDAA